MDAGWPEETGDDHAVTELLAHLSGALSPFGETQFPLPVDDLPYIHAKTVVNR
ncbi:hypothetical protein nbrc107696_15480 [Gordonia spumicola]|uniref:Uncharacterized protein n=1 Tax=Gordonia spumicola TaxID=589161 RepID=A0A7I9V7C1_9ACTN|nr:hypothetical protein nbrc107696_15480 [Gordonia spumicola]